MYVRFLLFDQNAFNLPSLIKIHKMYQSLIYNKLNVFQIASFTLNDIIVWENCFIVKDVIKRYL